MRSIRDWVDAGSAGVEGMKHRPVSWMAERNDLRPSGPDRMALYSTRGIVDVGRIGVHGREALRLDFAVGDDGALDCVNGGCVSSHDHE